MAEEVPVADAPMVIPERPPVSPVLRIWEDIRLATARLLHTVVFIVIVCLVIVAIGEMSGRDALLNMIDSRLNTLKADIVADAQNRRAKPQSKSSDDKSDDSKAVDEARSAEDRLKEVETLERTRLYVRSAVAFGATSPVRLSEVGEDLAEGKSKTFEPRSLSTGPGQLLSSDQLLAVVVLGSGAIGAMISVMRTASLASFAPLIHGLAAGFAAYLVIRGGKHLFLLPTPGEIVLFNPYGSAFAGLLAGLFTEKAHQLLSYLVDDLADRVRAASKSSPEKSRAA